MSKVKVFLIGFLITSLGELISVINNFQAHYIFKPLIVPMLIGYYFFSTDSKNINFIRALFFCWVGDFLLMFGSDEIYFMLGLVAFLIGHIYYILSFRQLVSGQPSTLLPTQRLRYTFPIFLAGTGLIVILYPGLGPLKIPVIIYATVLMIMVSFALYRTGRTNKSSFVFVFAGAIFFMISDSLLALNKFYSSFALASLAVMSTYILAQYLIVKGALAHEFK